jgi:hypothetical protein
VATAQVIPPLPGGFELVTPERPPLPATEPRASGAATTLGGPQDRVRGLGIQAPQASAAAGAQAGDVPPLPPGFEIEQQGAQPAPYRDRREALDDAVNFLDEGQDIGAVAQSFAGIGLTRQEIEQHARQRGAVSAQPQQAQPGTMSAQRYGLGAGQDSITPNATAVMPGASPFEAEVLNTVRRGLRAADRISTIIKSELGVITPEVAGGRIAQSNRASSAAQPGDRIAAGQEAIGEAQTLPGAIGAVVSNPVATLATLVESIIASTPALAATVGGAAAGGVPGAAVGGGLGSAATEYAASLAEAVTEAGGDPNNQADITAALQNPEVMAAAREKGAKRGIIVGTFGAISAGLAGRFVGPAQRAIEQGGRSQMGRATAKEAGTQLGLAGGGEAVAQAATGEYKPGDIVIEALADAPQSAVEVAAGVRADRQQQRGLGSIPGIAQPRREPTMGTQGSAGAAGTDKATQRRQTAAGLPVPVPLTEGQATREAQQQQFEKEIVKDAEVGRNLRDFGTEQTAAVLRNFDVLEEQTGATQTSPEAIGEAIVNPIVERVSRAKAQINAAYDAARAAGEMEEAVSTAALVDYLNQERPSEITAPILKAVADRLVAIGGATRGEDGALLPGAASLNDIQVLRQSVSADAGEPGTPNSMRAGQLKERIDAMTESAGGDLYKAANRLYREYAQEFKNQSLIRDLVGTKRGTSDRKIALEEVYRKTVQNGSVEDLRRLQDTLAAAGDSGAQALRELRGAAIRDIREQATRTTSRDETGQQVPSVAGLQRAVRALDKSGKLELLFGKQGAQTLRDLGEVASDIYTAPPGVVNSSGTAMAVTRLLGDFAASTAITGIPAPLLTTIRAIKNWRQGKKTQKRIDEAIAQPEPQALLRRPDPDARPFDAATQARPRPQPQPRTPPRAPETERVIALRKRASVLNSIRECLEA